MNLSKSTLDTLKNFAEINDGLVIIPGAFQETISVDHSIIAEATLDQEMPRGFAIGSLPSFLGVLSLYDNPDLLFEEGYVTVNDSNIPFQYRYTDPGLIHVRPEDQNLILTNVDAEFDVSIQGMDRLLKLAKVSTLPNLMIGGANGKLYLKIDDVKNDLSSEGTMNIADYEGPNFLVGFSIENLKMIPDNYTVQVGFKKFAHFISKKNNRKYTVPVLRERK